ncbi:MAG TPA: hypothetical protein VHB79_03620 [Polyangiaceae bacterium]|nr:hypothetical protein [Polyangiaceae bacterium]
MSAPSIVQTPGVMSPRTARQFSVAFRQDAIGGLNHDYADDIDNNRLLDCPEEFLKTGNIANGCEVAKVLDKADFGWLQIRKEADLVNESEHTLMSQLIAQQAGLIGEGMHLFDVFWLRYATGNSYLASPVQLSKEDLTPDHSRYLVAQSYLPTGGGRAEVHATRSVSLLEFSEVPDFASSVADWAAGSELCPIPGVRGVEFPGFSGQIVDVIMRRAGRNAPARS